MNFDNQHQGHLQFDEDGEPIYVNEDEDDDEPTFEGAINGDPMLNLANGLEMYGLPSKFLYGLTIDQDFSSMYPYSITAFNIFATTMIGKLIIPKYKPTKTYDGDMGKEYLEDIIIDDVLHIGTKWHNLSPYEVLANKVKQRYNIN